jgi:predicted DNA-binding transcriptional regulator
MRQEPEESQERGSKLLSYLSANPKRWHNANEIAKELEVEQQSARSAMMRIYRAGNLESRIIKEEMRQYDHFCLKPVRYWKIG